LAVILLIAGTSNIQAQSDTLRLKSNQILILKDSVFIPSVDTIIIISQSVKYRVKQNPYQKSAAFYEKLKSKSERSRLSKELYDLMVRDTARNVMTTSKGIKSEQYFKDYQGKRIARITVQHVQMITGSVTDTLKKSSSNIIAKIDNGHRKTRSKLIKDNLLIADGDILDPFLVADSERILRTYAFINDARIYILPSIENDETVEIIVVVQDRFPWSAAFDYSSINKFGITLAQQNIMGTANEIYGGYYYSENDEPVHGYRTGFITAPFANTFTRFQFFVEKNYRRNMYGISIEKPFVSPVIKWAGSLSVLQKEREISFNLEDSTYESFYDLDGADLWIARAWRPFRNNRKIISLGFRGVYTFFDDGPVVQSDSNTIFHNRYTYLGAVDYNKNNYVKTSNVLSIGITEDLPVGYSFGATFGSNFTQFGDEWYLGFRGQWNDFRDFGYISAISEIGGFRNKSGWSEGIWNNNLQYMSPLFFIGLNSVRTFFNITYVSGLNLSLPVSIHLGDYIDGLNGFFTQGNEALIFSLEPILFARWYWLGFRFAPYGRFEVGIISENRTKNTFREIYPAIGGGFRITNPGLVINTLDIGAKIFTNPAPRGDSYYFDITLSTRLPFRLNQTTKPEVLPYRRYDFLR
jgi:hypothetical protein